MKNLESGRAEFIDRVSGATLDSLLDKLLQKKAINYAEMEAVTGVNLSRADKARRLIDMVMRKGNKACVQLIDILHQLDPYLSARLKSKGDLSLSLCPGTEL